MATSASTRNSAPLEGELLPLHSQLLVEITDVLVVILGDYSTKKLQAGSRDRPTFVHNERLIASLTEISAMWDYCDQPTRVVIADSVVDVEQLLELFYDILYEACRGMETVIKHSDYLFNQGGHYIVYICAWTSNCDQGQNLTHPIFMPNPLPVSLNNLMGASLSYVAVFKGGS